VVIRGYQACVARTIARFQGFIARYVGDGVLIYFGWPEAREADAERAVRAALGVIAEVARASIGREKLQIRVGIATGLVVVGESFGAGEARQHMAIGATRRQIGGLFDCVDIGFVELKGLLKPVTAIYRRSAARNACTAAYDVSSGLPGVITSLYRVDVDDIEPAWSDRRCLPCRAADNHSAAGCARPDCGAGR
jgi:class 3 adenylate cyclase